MIHDQCRFDFPLLALTSCQTRLTAGCHLSAGMQAVELQTSASFLLFPNLLFWPSLSQKEQA